MSSNHQLRMTTLLFQNMWGNGGQYFAAVNTNATNAIQAATRWGTHPLMVTSWRLWYPNGKSVYICFVLQSFFLVYVYIFAVTLWLYHVHCTHCYSTRCVVRCDEHVGHVSRLACLLVGQVYKTYTCELIETLRGHTNKVPGGSQGEIRFWSILLDACKGYTGISHV